MMRLTTSVLMLLVLLSMGLAGCTDPGPDGGEDADTDPDPADPGTDGTPGSPSPEPEPAPSNETLFVRIDPDEDHAADAAWRVAVPVPIAVRGPTLDDWHDNVTIEGEASASVQETEGGQVLEVRGSGTVRLQAWVVWPPADDCCDDTFMNATWSAGTGDGGWPRAGVWSGGVILEIEYQGESTRCYRSDHVVGQGSAPGGGPGDDADEPTWFDLVGERRKGCG